MRSATSGMHSTRAIRHAVRCRATRAKTRSYKAYMSEDFREGMDASRNKRVPNFKGK